jgi:hypothetical protein
VVNSPLFWESRTANKITKASFENNEAQCHVFSPLESRNTHFSPRREVGAEATRSYIKWAEVYSYPYTTAESYGEQYSCKTCLSCLCPLTCLPGTVRVPYHSLTDNIRQHTLNAELARAQSDHRRSTIHAHAHMSYGALQ